MNDVVGRALLNWRIRTVLPEVRGDLLDVGCGNNELVRTYRNSGARETSRGVDVYPWAGVDQVITDAGRLPFPDASFDTVSCLAALNHIPNRSEFLKDTSRVLRPGGRFLMTMIPPRISRVWHFLRSPWDADQHERGMVEGEVFGFSRAQVVSLLADAGFEVERVVPFMLGVNSLYVCRLRDGAAAGSPPQSRE